MMKFARVEDGVVVEILPSEYFPAELVPESGDVREIYHPDFSMTLINVTSFEPMPIVGDVLQQNLDSRHD